MGYKFSDYTVNKVEVEKALATLPYEWEWGTFERNTFFVTVPPLTGLSESTAQKRVGQAVVLAIREHTTLFPNLKGKVHGANVAFSFSDTNTGVPKAWLPKGAEEDCYPTELRELRNRLNGWNTHFGRDESECRLYVRDLPTVSFVVDPRWEEPSEFAGLLVRVGENTRQVTVEEGEKFVRAFRKLWDALPVKVAAK